MRVAKDSLKVLNLALPLVKKLCEEVIPKQEAVLKGAFTKKIPDYIIVQLQVVKGLFSLENETQTLLFTKAFLKKYFKKIPSQPTLNRRSKELAPFIEEIRRKLLLELGVGKKEGQNY